MADTVMTSKKRRLRAATRVLVAVTPLVLLAGACGAPRTPIGVPLPDTTRLESEWRNYLRLPASKAMAIAGDPAGIYVSGYSFGHPTELAAVEAALHACEARREDRRIPAPCQTYAVGDQPVATASVRDNARR